MKYLALLLASQLAVAGGFVGNGMQDYLEETGSWFTAGGPVRWCIQRPVNINLPYSTIFKEINRAFLTWEDYVARKSPFKERAPNFSLKFVFSGDCTGSEHIAVFLGFESPEVAKERAKYDNPIGFVKRTSFDPLSGRGKGYLWLNSNPAFSWFVYPNLFAVSLHEIGHILGCEDVDGTIMDKRLNKILKANVGHFANPDHYESAYNLNALLRIDFTKELYLNPTDGIEIWGYRGPPNAEMSSLFRTLINHVPKGPVSIGFIQGWEEKNHLARLYLMEVNPNGEKDEKGILKFQKWKLDIHLDPILEFMPISDGLVFKTEKINGEIVPEKVRGYMRTGLIKLPTGKSYPILYNRNRADDTVVDIHYMVDGRYRPLFKASPLQQLGDQRVFKD